VVSFPQVSLHTSLFSPIRATCPAHLILLDVITRTILGEEYRSLSSSLCSFLHSPITVVHPRPKYSKHPIPKIPQPAILPQCQRPSFTPIQHNRQNYSSVYLNLSISWYKTGRQKILHRMIASIPCLSICDLVVSLPIRRGPAVLMNVSVREYHALNNQIFYVAKFTSLTPLSLLSWCRLSFPTVGLKIFSLSPLLH